MRYFGCDRFIWRTCPNHFRWTLSCGWLRRPKAARSVALQIGSKMLNVRLVHCQMRRICMLDAIIVLVTIITFIAFIGYAEGCERL